MKTQLTEVSSTRREIKIEIDAQTVKEAYNKVSRKYVGAATVPGFRKGNAPLDVIKMRYKEEIRNDVLQEVLPKAVTEAIEEHQLHPLAEPDIHIDDAANIALNGSQDISLYVRLEVMPEIPTPEYKGLELTRRIRPVDDAQVENLIDERLQQQAALIPVEDRKSQTGDTVIVDLEGNFEDDPQAEPIKADDLEIPIGDESIELAFSENLIGLSEDDEKEFTVAYPADFSSPVLAGKTVNYKAKVKSVGTLEKPELDDEWAKSLDEGYDSVGDLRVKLREDLQKYSESDADARLRNDAIQKFIEKHEFEIPGALIEVQARNLLNNFAQDLQQRGVDLNKVEKEFVQMAYNQMQTQAERDVRGAMLLEKVAEIEKVEVADADVDEEISKMAEYYRAEPDEIRKSMEAQEGGIENVRSNLRTRKAIETLIANAKVTDGEWIDENQMPEVETETEEVSKEAKKSSKKKETSKEKTDEDKSEVKEPKKKTAKKDK
jgi:trigger factor